jgi:two-component system chemotaxis response regulator CheY
MKLFKAVNDTTNLHLQAKKENARSGIMIVDDSRFSRNILKDILKNEGYMVVGEAGDGFEAIEMARDKRPEYIFMDVEMPRLDGLGAIPKILEMDPDIHIIMCTALGQKKIIVEAAKAGAKDYVIKPYKKENIMGVMSVISNTHQKDAQVIPFKAGKKHTEELNIEDIRIEEQKPFEYEEVSDNNDIKEYEIIPEADPTKEKETDAVDLNMDKNEVHKDKKFPDISIDLEEFIEPLDSSLHAGENSNTDNVNLDSSLESEKLKAEIEKYMKDTFVDEKLSAGKDEFEMDETADVFEITNIEEPTKSEIKKAEDLQLKDDKSNVNVMDDIYEVTNIENKGEALETDVADKNLFQNIDQVNSDFDFYSGQSVSTKGNNDYGSEMIRQEEVKGQKEIKGQEKVKTENAVYIMHSDSPYAYLWMDRFSTIQGDDFICNSMNNRASFYRCANLENDIYNLLGQDNSERKVMLGMISSYMSGENRLQQKGGNFAFGARMSSYTGGGRIFACTVLNESQNKSSEICLIDTVRLYDNGLPKSSHENLKSTGLYIAVHDLVNEKANRIFG